jgi:hypothetical protein
VDPTQSPYYNNLSPLPGFRSKDGSVVTVEPNSKLVQIKTGYCVYPNTVKCKTSQGCRDHDACFDWCAAHGETAVTGPCHMKCTWVCMCEYGTSNCVLWSRKLGDLISALGERLYPPPYDPQDMYFSDPPEFYETPAEPTPTVTTNEHWYECMMAPMNCHGLEGIAYEKCIAEEYARIPGGCE